MPIYQHILTVNNLLSTIYNLLFTIHYLHCWSLLNEQKSADKDIEKQAKPALHSSKKTTRYDQRIVFCYLKIGTDFCQSRFNQLIWQFLYLWRVVKYNRFLNVNILS